MLRSILALFEDQQHVLAVWPEGQPGLKKLERRRKKSFF
jgi:hypothetical protein